MDIHTNYLKITFNDVITEGKVEVYTALYNYYFDLSDQ